MSEAFFSGLVVGAIGAALLTCGVTTCTVHHNAAAKGAGYYEVNPLTGDTTWVWREHPSPNHSYAPVRYRPMTPEEEAAEKARHLLPAEASAARPATAEAAP